MVESEGSVCPCSHLHTFLRVCDGSSADPTAPCVMCAAWRAARRRSARLLVSVCRDKFGPLAFQWLTLMSSRNMQLSGFIL